MLLYQSIFFEVNLSFPIVVIFERHWDTVPKLLVKDLLPNLVKQGYDTLCFEAPQNLSSAEIIKRHNSELEFDLGIQQQAEELVKLAGITQQLSAMSFSNLFNLMRLYVSSKEYVEVAEKIKQLPASLILKEVFDEATQLHVSVKGVDIDNEDFDKIFSSDLSGRVANIKINEDYRITTIFQNLLKLRTQQKKGVIFVCGCLHASGLLSKFKEQNMQDEIFYYFPHSSSRYDDSVDDVSKFARNDTLLNHTYLLTQQEVRPFCQKIIREITNKRKYREIPGGNSHSQFLSQYFKTNFRAFFRPGYYVDALVGLDDSSNIEAVRNCFNKVGIQTHDISWNDRGYLVVPNVNTKEIADKIRKISS